MATALIESIEAHFNDMENPRRASKNKCHDFLDILVIALCGAIAAYGRAKEEWFHTFLALSEGIPSHDTFNDVYAKIDGQQFERCFIAWVKSISNLLPGEVISVDGKTLRRSHDQANGKRSIHRVSAWSTSNELVLGQFKAKEKSNEKS